MYSLGSIKFLVSEKQILFYFPIRCHVKTIMIGLPIDTENTHIVKNHPWHLPAMFVVKCSMVSDENNFKIFFSVFYFKSILPWQPSWTSNPHKNWQCCKGPSNDYYRTSWIQSNTFFFFFFRKTILFIFPYDLIAISEKKIF